LREGEVTVASVLKEAGYATGGFGKWGCGGRGSTGVPEDHGFDEFFGYYDQVHAHSYYPAYLIRNSEEVPLSGNIGGRSGDTYSQYEIVNEARDFIRESAEGPFFCYLPLTTPHGLFDIPDEDPAWALYADEGWSMDARRYAAMVTMLDRQVGEVIDLIEELGLREDTLIFFCGDNGGNDYFKGPETPRGFHGANVDPLTGVEFRGRKGTLYEGGLRVSMIANWPGRIEAGVVSEQLWFFGDVLPTLAEVAGAPAPAGIDGISVAPTLFGDRASQREHEYLYWELGQKRAVRMGDWKAVRPGKGKAWELYRLDQDASEVHDLAALEPDVLDRLKGYALAAHTPQVEGVFHDRSLHERDRQAKWGTSPDKPKPRPKPEKKPTPGG
jgi:arylsulfatase A-like enzyme